MQCSCLDKFHTFISEMKNRIIVGEAQYGPPSVDKRFLRRLKRELRWYERTGNVEHLRNVGNYAFLERYWPENIKSHDDNTVDSVTR